MLRGISLLEFPQSVGPMFISSRGKLKGSGTVNLVFTRSWCVPNVAGRRTGTRSVVFAGSWSRLKQRSGLSRESQRRQTWNEDEGSTKNHVDKLADSRQLRHVFKTRLLLWEVEGTNKSLLLQTNTIFGRVSLEGFALLRKPEDAKHLSAFSLILFSVSATTVISVQGQ